MTGHAPDKRIRAATSRPERSPVEMAFRHPGNDRPGNRAFADVAAVTDACRKAREAVRRRPGSHASIVRREWAIAPAPAARTGQNG